VARTGCAVDIKTEDVVTWRCASWEAAVVWNYFFCRHKHSDVAFSNK